MFIVCFVYFKSLVTFVNKHLNKINLEVTDLETQFHDGVYLVLLMGLLEGYFVPMYSYYLTPTEFDQKVCVTKLSMMGDFLTHFYL